MQLVAAEQETAASDARVEPVGFGLGTTVQLDPFHRSTNDFVVAPASKWPTAVQLVAPEHDTPTSTVSVEPLGFGLGTTVQFDPFHRSTNDLIVEPLRNEPTAVQLVAPEHDTPLSAVPVDPLGSGMDTMFQLVAAPAADAGAISPPAIRMPATVSRPKRKRRTVGPPVAPSGRAGSCEDRDITAEARRSASHSSPYMPDLSHREV